MRFYRETSFNLTLYHKLLIHFRFYGLQIYIISHIYSILIVCDASIISKYKYLAYLRYEQNGMPGTIPNWNYIKYFQVYLLAIYFISLNLHMIMILYELEYKWFKFFTYDSFDTNFFVYFKKYILLYIFKYKYCKPIITNV